MTKTFNPAAVAAPSGPYSHGAEIPPGARVLYIAGQVGITKDGTVVPDIKGQSEQVWRNLIAVLAEAGMGLEHLVKVNHYLTRPENIPAYGEVRARILGVHRPASTLVVIPALITPALLVEVEAVAAK